MYHLQSSDGKHNFYPGTTFQDVIQHYQFDKMLRSLTMTYLERIEIALRAQLTDNFSKEQGFFWYAKRELYDDHEVYNQINTEIADRFAEPQERFLKSFKNRYQAESMPPSNMALEVLTLGKLTRLYKGLSNKAEKVAVARAFGLPSSILSSWFVYLNNIRNVCAHHSRLWNRRTTADRPQIPTRKDHKFSGTLPDDFNTTYYGTTSLIKRLLDEIDPGNRFIEDLGALMERFPTIRIALMGFPADWKESPAWQRAGS